MGADCTLMREKRRTGEMQQKVMSLLISAILVANAVQVHIRLQRVVHVDAVVALLAASTPTPGQDNAQSLHGKCGW